MQIWVTLLTIAGALVATWLGAWLVGRQAAKDLRANIDREIEILKRLRPDSEEANLLDINIRKNISDLVAQDNKRRQRAEQDNTTTWVFGAFSVVSFSTGLMGSWRSRGYWEPLRPLLEGVFWSLWLVYSLLLIRVLMVAISWARPWGKVGGLMMRVGLLRSRVVLLKTQYKLTRFRIMPLYRVAEALMANSEAISAWHVENDGAEISEEAVRRREELFAERERLIRKGRRRSRLLRLRSMGKGRRGPERDTPENASIPSGESDPLPGEERAQQTDEE